MTIEEAKAVIYGNVVYACEKAGFAPQTTRLVQDACDTIIAIADACETIVALVDRKTENSSEFPNNCEAQTETKTETKNSNLNFEKRKCIDCKFLTYMFGKTWCNIKCENPHDKVCDRFKPKDEPQTERGEE